MTKETALRGKQILDLLKASNRSQKGLNTVSTLLYQPLMITPYKSEATTLHTKENLLPVLVSD
jgi:hypothetical protein